MSLAGLFWCYHTPELCLDRIRTLRAFNPGLRLYGLFGGEKSESLRFRDCFNLLDDFYISPLAQTPYWKWRNGDLILLDWYHARGHRLAFDRIAILQWDLLVLDSLEKLFGGLRGSDILLSSARPIAEVGAEWVWTCSAGERDNYLRFCEYCRDELGYSGELWACQFVVACLSRQYLDRWLTISKPELGFLEYKLPTYARIFGMPIKTRSDLDTTWLCSGDPTPFDWKIPLSTCKAATVTTAAVSWHLRYSNHRVFHPFVSACPGGIEREALGLRMT